MAYMVTPRNIAGGRQGGIQTAVVERAPEGARVESRTTYDHFGRRKIGQGLVELLGETRFESHRFAHVSQFYRGGLAVAGGRERFAGSQMSAVAAAESILVFSANSAFATVSDTVAMRESSAAYTWLLERTRHIGPIRDARGDVVYPGFEAAAALARVSPLLQDGVARREDVYRILKGELDRNLPPGGRVRADALRSQVAAGLALFEAAPHLMLGAQQGRNAYTAAAGKIALFLNENRRGLDAGAIAGFVRGINAYGFMNLDARVQVPIVEGLAKASGVHDMYAKSGALDIRDSFMRRRRAGALRAAVEYAVTGSHEKDVFLLMGCADWIAHAKPRILEHGMNDWDLAAYRGLQFAVSLMPREAGQHARWLELLREIPAERGTPLDLTNVTAAARVADAASFVRMQRHRDEASFEMMPNGLALLHSMRGTSDPALNLAANAALLDLGANGHIDLMKSTLSGSLLGALRSETYAPAQRLEAAGLLGRLHQELPEAERADFSVRVQKAFRTELPSFGQTLGYERATTLRELMRVDAELGHAFLPRGIY